MSTTTSTTATQRARATREALDVPEIKHVHLGVNQFGQIAGVAYDREHGVEYDVRQEGHHWLVNDDEGRYYKARSLRRALKKAIAGQKGEK